MKEGWERKKIKEVADVIGGSTPKTNVEEYWGGNNYWVTPAELDGSKYIEKTVRCITSNAVDKTNLTLMPSGTVLLSSRAPIGKVCITKAPMYCNQGFKNLICKKLLYNEFAYYFLKHNVDYLQSLGTGATFKEISKKVVENVTIPVPPLSEQQHIVEELDLLSSIIEKKKAQLNELDNLAQSLFYEMFGDPITNEKGWEVKKLGKLCITSSGGTPSKTHKEYYEGGNIPWLRSGEVAQGFIYNTEICITEEGLNNSSAKYFPTNTVVVAMYGATVGQVGIIKNRMTTNQAICGIFPNELFVPTFLMFFLKGMKPVYLKDAAGGAQPNISQGVIKNTLVPIVSIDLQQQFVERVETIEHQKELTKQSIKEVETLFNSRMDYYFNSLVSTK